MCSLGPFSLAGHIYLVFAYTHWKNFIILFSLLVAIGIEAFNRFSQLKRNKKNEATEKPEMTPKMSRQTSRQEDEVTAASEYPSTLNVCEFYKNFTHIYNKVIH